MEPASRTFKRFDHVQTPAGVGRVDGYDLQDHAWLVCLSRNDFTPKEWKRISPNGGPCVFRMYSESYLTPIPSTKGR